MFVPSAPGLPPLLPFQRESASQLPFPLDREQRICAGSAASLTYHLFRALELEPNAIVLAPDYHAIRNVRAMRAAGARLRFYRVRRDLSVDLEDLERQLTPDVRALCVMHAFGFPQSIAELTALASARNVTLVEDCCEALFSSHEGRPLGSFGAHALFCLATSLPVPNGGVLVSGGRPFQILSMRGWRRSDLFSLARPSLKLLARSLSFRSGSSEGAERDFDPAEARFEMAPLTRHILGRIDFDAVPVRRREIYSTLLHQVGGAIAPLLGDLPPGVCPYVLPIAVDDKDAALHELSAAGVSVVDRGRASDAGVDERSAQDARWLREHVIGVPVHQELDDAQIEHLVHTLRALGRSQRKVHPLPAKTDLRLSPALRIV